MFNNLYTNDDDAAARALGNGNVVNVDDEEDDDDVIILHIDIRQPIKQLRTLLEQRIGVSLRNYEFWLQDAQMVRRCSHLQYEQPVLR